MKSENIALTRGKSTQIKVIKGFYTAQNTL